jgi:hypothetical protein
MKITPVFTWFVTFLLSSAGFAAADVYVIANKGTSVTATEIKDVFLGEKQFSGSLKLVPIDNAALQEDFTVKALKMDIKKYNNFWAKKSFRDGINPPVGRSGDAEVAEFIRRTPGAIGYVEIVPSGVSVIKKY